jgi:cysteine desulfurase
MNDFIYLDNNATTVLDPDVQKLLSTFPCRPYNPSSLHFLGKEAKKILAQSKETVACALRVPSSTLCFTSGGTESMNMLIKGLYPGHGSILTTAIEHSCVYETLNDLKKNGVSVEYVASDSTGAPSLNAIKSHINTTTSMMVFSAVYSETGVMVELETIAKLARDSGILLVIDGVAILGKEDFIVYPGITGMGFSSHKLHGPKGVGLAYLSSDASCTPLLLGGPQEKGLRAGTENLEGIYGFAKAVELISKQLPSANKKMQELRNLFEKLLFKDLDDILINGDGLRICNTSNIYFPDVEAETLLIALDRHGICASAGSACSSGALEPSRVLLNMGYSRKRAKCSLRFSFSRFNTKEEIEKAALIVCEVVKKLRSF